MEEVRDGRKLIGKVYSKKETEEEDYPKMEERETFQGRNTRREGGNMNIEEFDKEVLMQRWKETRVVYLEHVMLDAALRGSAEPEKPKKRTRKQGPPTEAQLAARKKFAEQAKRRAEERRVEKQVEEVKPEPKPEPVPKKEEKPEVVLESPDLVDTDTYDITFE